jgi:hypothetical protein
VQQGNAGECWQQDMVIANATPRAVAKGAGSKSAQELVFISVNTMGDVVARPESTCAIPDPVYVSIHVVHIASRSMNRCFAVTLTRSYCSIVCFRCMAIDFSSKTEIARVPAVRGPG